MRSNLATISPGISSFAPPAEPLTDVFTPEVLGNWRAKRTEEIERRLEILEAHGPYPDDCYSAADLRFLIARKAAWHTYLYSAFACGMFEGVRGAELRSRLIGRDAANFRSAMAECLTCWFLAGKMRLAFDATAPGRAAKNLDMRVLLCGQNVGIEVKAPYRAATRSWSGDDADKIAECLSKANKQLGDSRPNLVILLPTLRRRMYTHRRDLVKACFGQHRITWDINAETGEVGPTSIEFSPDGKFLNTRFKNDGFPSNRRISAVVCIEENRSERYPEPHPLALFDESIRSEVLPSWQRDFDLHYSNENDVWISHDVLVVHNPYAYHPLVSEPWNEFSQCVPEGDVMIWTDGEEVVV